MITVYHLANSRSERVIWALEELGLEYRLERFDREPSMAASAAFRALHPLGKSPIIRDGETLLVESGAIVEYIVMRAGGGRLAVPVTSPDYARYLQWMHFSEGSAMTQLVLQLFFGGMVPGVDQSSPMVARIMGQTTTLLGFLEGELARSPYFAGDDFTAADLMMTYPLGAVKNFLKIDLGPYPAIAAYLDRIAERPAYQKAMSIANP